MILSVILQRGLKLKKAGISPLLKLDIWPLVI